MRVVRSLLVVSFFVVIAATLFPAGPHASFSPYVDSPGLISLPDDFRTTWVHLGSWVVTSTAAAGTGLGQANPGTGIHNVYTQPGSLKDYRKTARWPDGAILVMEVRNLNWDDLPTGHVMVAGEPVKWFVMVKDAKGRFPGNPNWGDGWGWAFWPVQVTRDLASFWNRGYPEGKKELKGRYPKHYWPEDPFTAVPTRRVRPQGTR